LQILYATFTKKEQLSALAIPNIAKGNFTPASQYQYISTILVLIEKLRERAPLKHLEREFGMYEDSLSMPMSEISACHDWLIILPRYYRKYLIRSRITHYAREIFNVTR